MHAGVGKNNRAEEGESGKDHYVILGLVVQ